MGGLVEQLPQSDSYVGLDPDRTDDHGNPVPEIHWSVGDRALRTIERANEIQRSVLEELGAEIEWVAGPDATGPAYHHHGNHPDERRSRRGRRRRRLPHPRSGQLLDRVQFGVSTSGAMNPTLTIAALALRVADDVRDRL